MTRILCSENISASSERCAPVLRASFQIDLCICICIEMHSRSPGFTTGLLIFPRLLPLFCSRARVYSSVYAVWHTLFRTEGPGRFSRGGQTCVRSVRRTCLGREVSMYEPHMNRGSSSYTNISYSNASTPSGGYCLFL